MSIFQDRVYTPSTIGGASVLTGASAISTGSMLKQEALAKAVRRNQRTLAQYLGLLDVDQSKDLVEDLQTTIATSLATSQAEKKNKADLLNQVFDRIRSFNPLEYEIQRQQNDPSKREDTDISRRQARNVLNVVDKILVSRGLNPNPCNYLFVVSQHICRLANNLSQGNQNSAQVFDQLPGALHLFSLIVPANSPLLIQQSFVQYSPSLTLIAPYINNVHIGNAMVIIIAHILKSLKPKDWKICAGSQQLHTKSESSGPSSDNDNGKTTKNSTANSIASKLFQILLSSAASTTPSIRHRTKVALTVLIKSVPPVLHPLIGSHLFQKIQKLYSKLITEFSSISSAKSASIAKSDALNNILDLLPHLLPSMTNLFSSRRFQLEPTFKLLFSFLSSHARLAETPISINTMKAITALCNAVESATQLSLDDEPLISFPVLFDLFQQNLNINQNLSAEFRKGSVTQHTIMLCAIYSLLHKIDPVATLEPARFLSFWTLLLSVYADPIVQIAKSITPAIRKLMSSTFDQSLIMDAYNIGISASKISTSGSSDSHPSSAGTASSSSLSNTNTNASEEEEEDSQNKLKNLLSKHDPFNQELVQPDRELSRIEIIADLIVNALKLQNKPVWTYLHSLLAQLYKVCQSKSAIILKNTTLTIATIYNSYFESFDSSSLTNNGSTSGSTSVEHAIMVPSTSKTDLMDPDNLDVQIRSSFKKTMGVCISTVGTPACIEIFSVHFNVDPFNSQFSNSKTGWTWLIPLIRDYTKHAPIGFFLTYFLPILQNIQKHIQILSTSQQSLKNNAQKTRIRQKVIQWSSLWTQIWSCLPAFCATAPDLEATWTSLAPILFSQIRSPQSTSDLVITCCTAIQKVCQTLLSEEADTLYPDPLALSLLVCQTFDLPTTGNANAPGNGNLTLDSEDNPASRNEYSLGGFPTLFAVICMPSIQEKMRRILTNTIDAMVHLVSNTVQMLTISPKASNRDFISYTYYSMVNEPKITYSIASVQNIFTKFIASAISKFRAEIPALQSAMVEESSIHSFKSTLVVNRVFSLLTLICSLGSSGNADILQRLFSLAEFLLWNNGISPLFPLPSGGKFASNAKNRKWISITFSRPAWRLINLAISNPQFILNFKSSSSFSSSSSNSNENDQEIGNLTPWEILVDCIVNTPMASSSDNVDSDSLDVSANPIGSAGENTRLAVYIQIVASWPQNMSCPAFDDNGKPVYVIFDPMNPHHSKSLEAFKTFAQKIMPDILFSLQSNKKSRHLGFNLLVDIPYTLLKMVRRMEAASSKSDVQRDIQQKIKEKKKQAFKNITSASELVTDLGDEEEEEGDQSSGMILESEDDPENSPMVHVIQYIEFVKAGWAGSTASMTTSTILALMRILNEFGYLLPDPVIASLFESIQALLQKQDREIVRACFQFVRICFVCLPRRHMASSLDSFVPLILAHSLDSHLRRQARIVIERYIKKFTIHPLIKCLTDLHANETHFKFVQKIASDLRRSKSKKASETLLKGSKTSGSGSSNKSSAHLSRQEKREIKKAEKEKQFKQKVKDIKSKHEAKRRAEDAPQFDVDDILLDSRGKIHVQDIERIKGIRKQRNGAYSFDSGSDDDDSWDDDDDDDWSPTSGSISDNIAKNKSKTKSGISVPISQDLVMRSKRRLDTLTDPSEIAALDNKYDHRKRKRRY